METLSPIKTTEVKADDLVHSLFRDYVTGNAPQNSQLTHKETIGLGLEDGQFVKVVFYSYSRNDTSCEIFDSKGRSMADFVFTYAARQIDAFSAKVLEELNVLLDLEYGTSVNSADVKHVVLAAARKCESHYGKGANGGDFIWLLS